MTTTAPNTRTRNHDHDPMTQPHLSIEEQLERDVPDWETKVEVAIAAGTFHGLADFLEENRPLARVAPAPDTLAQATATIAELQSTIERRAAEMSAAAEGPTIAALRTRAETAERQLSGLRGLILDLESAERASALGQRILELTNERDAALTAKAWGDQNIARLEKFCGICGIDPATAVPSANADQVVEGGSPVARYKRAVANGNEKERREIFAAHKDEIWAELQPTSTLPFRS